MVPWLLWLFAAVFAGSVSAQHHNQQAAWGGPSQYYQVGAQEGASPAFQDGGPVASSCDGGCGYDGWNDGWNGGFGGFGGALASRPRHFSRTLPPGNLSQRYPYHALRFYYYDRPYNAFQVEQRYRERYSGGTTSPYQPYSRQVFSSIYEQAQQQILDSRFLGYAARGPANPEFVDEPSEQQIARDKNFEYTDWRQHHRARLKWDYEQLLVEQGTEPPSETQQGILQSSESPLEFKDVSHPQLQPNPEFER